MQTVAVPGVHAPDWHVSPVVHAFPSLQLVPFAFAGFEQVPVAVSHVPATWHWSLAPQTTGFPDTQAPARQVSASVQAFPSLQAVPSPFAGFEQTPDCGSQVPATWHWSAAAQTTALPPTHAPD